MKTHAQHAKAARLATPCSAHHARIGGGCLNCGWGMKVEPSIEVNPRSWIVLAKVEMDGIELTGRFLDRLQQVPETRAVPVAKSVTWRYGEDICEKDLQRARAYAPTEGYQVFVYPLDEKHPHERARAEVLAAFNQNLQSTP
jgi:hypothetical protein